MTTTRAAAAVLLAAGLLTATATPATAAPATGFTGVTTTRAPSVIGSCPSGYHCLYSGPFSGVQRKAFFASDPDFSNDFYPNGDPVNDNSTGAVNSSNGGYQSHYYANAGYGGFLFCLNPGYQVEYLPSWLQDQASSLQVRPMTSVSCLA